MHDLEVMSGRREILHTPAGAAMLVDVASTLLREKESPARTRVAGLIGGDASTRSSSLFAPAAQLIGDGMPAPPVDAGPPKPNTIDHADVACGYRWTDAETCHSGSEHTCSRTSRGHRSHLCACDALQLPKRQARTGGCVAPASAYGTTVPVRPDASAGPDLTTLLQQRP